MKKLFLGLALLLCFTGPAIASIKQVPTSCDYTLESSFKETKHLVKMDFRLLQESPDKILEYWGLSLHNPNSKDPNSVDGLVVFMRDKRIPDRELIIMVGYDTPKSRIIYVRQMKKVPTKQKDGSVKNVTSPGECFDKVEEAKK